MLGDEYSRASSSHLLVVCVGWARVCGFGGKGGGEGLYGGCMACQIGLVWFELD
jgi:hypothetical protein